MVLDACSVFPRTASVLPLAGIKLSSLNFFAKNRRESDHFSAVLSTQANSIIIIIKQSSKSSCLLEH